MRTDIRNVWKMKVSGREVLRGGCWAKTHLRRAVALTLLALLAVLWSPVGSAEAATPEEPSVLPSPDFVSPHPDSSEVLRSYTLQFDSPGVIARLAGELDRSQAEILAVEAEVLASQEGVIRAAEQIGAQVISRYSTSVNGLLLHATARQMDLLNRLPGVARVEPALIVRPLLERSAPHIGAKRIAEELGYDGSGSVVAIIDTGVDYTHAHFGGPGTVAAWQAASASGATEVITDTFDGALLYPNEKMVGGWDFVGPRYDTPEFCTPARHAAGECSNIPEPDPDPLDGAFHGTHVGGIVAGLHVSDNLAEGVAPGAKLVALKLYGQGGNDEAADVLVDAIEWCARVNLGIETRGVMPERIDAINISLGEGNAQGSFLFDDAVSAAVESGIVVVASAGNSGNAPYILGSPSSSPQILSVASSQPPSLLMNVVTIIDGKSYSHPGVDSSLAPFTGSPAYEGELALMGRACNDDPIIQDVSEKMALVARGSCSFREKLLNAQNAGATTVLMYTDNRGKNAMSGNPAGIELRAVMIDNEDGLALRQLLEGETEILVQVDPSRAYVNPDTLDAISGFSSRGPSKHGALKPDITGPGSGIVSASWRSGSGGTGASGTSMSGPHVAGAAALIQQRNREEGLGMNAAQVGAMLMNTARPIVHYPGRSGAPVPVVRQGAGLVDLWRAATAPLVIEAGDIASIQLGALALDGVATEVRNLTVSNVSTRTFALDLGAELLHADDFGHGLDIPIPEIAYRIDPGQSLEIPISFVFDPSKFWAWQERQNEGQSAGSLDASELDGYVFVQAVPIDNLEDESAAIRLSVPFHAIARRASKLAAGPLPKALDAEGAGLVFRGQHTNADFAGDIEIFMLPEHEGAESVEDPNEDDVLRELDIRDVGLRYELPSQNEALTETHITFGIARHEAAVIPHVTRLSIYVDIDADGIYDRIIEEARGGGQFFARVGEWNPISQTVQAGSWTNENVSHQSDLFGHLTMISLPIRHLDLDAPQAIAFYVRNRGTNEDWLDMPFLDFAPDTASQPGGSVYRFDPNSPARVPSHWSGTLAGGEVIGIDLERGPGERDAGFLAFYPDDAFDIGMRQMERIVPGLAPPRPHLYLPYLISEDE